MSKSIIKTALYSMLPLFGLVGITAGGCSTTIDQHDDGHIGATEQALTPEQCNYFAVDGKVQICHRTASTKKPYTILKISEQACVNAHAVHAGDYVAVNDPQCQGTGCLPADAPCDPTVPCCDGFSCVNGTCEANVSDQCDPSPCQNGGSCVNDANGYTCDCPAGYTGSNCETEIDECASNPCVNGDCLDGINSYVCECAPGYTGPTCADAVDPCASNPCENDGVCLPDGNSYFCYCQTGWTGPICTEVVNPCDPNPCQNVGFCMPDGTSYACTCQSGWTGPNCDTAIGATGYDCGANNPCTPENIAGGNFYFPASSSTSNFVQCTDWGQCFVMPCMPGTVWNQSAQTCVLP